jgi:hypothetical protein
VSAQPEGDRDKGAGTIKPDDYPQMPRGTCEASSRILARLDPRLTLVHGHLIMRPWHDLPEIRVDHWWCVTPDGQVIDRTTDFTYGVGHRYEPSAVSTSVDTP